MDDMMAEMYQIKPHYSFNNLFVIIYPSNIVYLQKQYNNNDDKQYR